MKCFDNNTSKSIVNELFLYSDIILAEYYYIYETYYIGILIHNYE